jgi:Domain of unknown function (DUF1929)
MIEHHRISLSRRGALGLLASAGGVAAELMFPTEARAAPIDVGAWSPVYDLGFVPIHLHLLPSGRIFLLQDDNQVYPARGPGYVVGYIIDLPIDGVPGTKLKIENEEIDLFCSGHSFMPDGRLFFIGGAVAQKYGASGATIFDYRTNTWETNTSLPHSYARWYGSAITLGTGEILTVGGLIDNTPNKLPQVWSSASSYRNLTGAVRSVEFYPSLFTAPNGKVFRAGPEQQSLWLTPDGIGSWSNGPARKFGRRKYGPCAMFAPGRIIAIGGGLKTAGDPTNTAEVIDLNAASPAWQFTGSMQYARRHANAVVLPDGTVLVVGGTSKGTNNAAGRVLVPELWNSETGQWTPMASMKKPRLYHSTAMLLPDGRVIAGGGGRSGTSYPNCEIFSPPYLLNGSPRPSISAPGVINYGVDFIISTPDAQSISSVCLIRIGSVTHTFNMNQRRVPLSFTAGVADLTVSVPTNRSNLPPGHYMLFALNALGVPSVAPIIQVA